MLHSAGEPPGGVPGGTARAGEPLPGSLERKVRTLLGKPSYTGSVNNASGRFEGPEAYGRPTVGLR